MSSKLHRVLEGREGALAVYLPGKPVRSGEKGKRTTAVLS